MGTVFILIFHSFSRISTCHWISIELLMTVSSALILLNIFRPRASFRHFSVFLLYFDFIMWSIGRAISHIFVLTRNWSDSLASFWNFKILNDYTPSFLEGSSLIYISLCGILSESTFLNKLPDSNSPDN